VLKLLLYFILLKSKACAEDEGNVTTSTVYD